MLAVENQTIVVPSIWAVEICNALLARERRRRIRAPEVRRFVALLNALSVVEDRRSFSGMVSEVLPLAREQELSAYDAAYLDVSVRHEQPIATHGDALRKASAMAEVTVFRI